MKIDMEELIKDFFNKTYESNINNLMLELDYEFPKCEIINYVKSVIDSPIEKFIDWINLHSFFMLDSTDVPQLSNFEDAFYKVVTVLLKNGDKGSRYLEIGMMLQDDGMIRNDMANRKYGENHSKAAEYLGYLFSLKYYYYVSCIGHVLEYLTEEEKKKLFVRLLIRTNLFKAVYLFTKNSNKDLNMRNLLDFLSDKTYARRKSNIKLLLNSLNSCEEYDFTELLSKLKY